MYKLVPRGGKRFFLLGLELKNYEANWKDNKIIVSIYGALS